MQEIVGKEFVTTDCFATFAYSRDTSVFGGIDAEIVVRPGSTEEVSRIMSLAYQNRIPVCSAGWWFKYLWSAQRGSGFQPFA